MAAKESQGLLTRQPAQIERLLCRALEGNTPAWQELPEIAPLEFLQLCRSHGIAALLFHRAQRGGGWESWPLEVREGLMEASRAGVAEELLARHYLRELVEAFAERNIPCLLMKGEALALSHYPEPGTRARSDIDLLIRPGDIDCARRTVLGLGYEIRTPVYASREFTVTRIGDAEYNVRFDIHWRILNHFRFAQALSFEEAESQSVPMPGLPPARMLCPPDALFLACLHRLGSESHNPDKLIWLHDIFVIASQLRDAGWERFTLLAMRATVQEACLDGLLTAAAHFDYHVPARVLEALMFSSDGSPHPQGKETPLSLLIADWRDLKGVRSRLGLLRELALPSPQGVLAKYGKSSWLWLPALYVLRAIGGLARRLSRN